MTNSNRHPGEDLLDRYIDAVHQQATAGPDDKALADTLTALRGALSEQTPSNNKNFGNIFQKVITMTYLHRKAVAFTVAAGGVFALVAFLLIGAIPRVSFAAVADKLRDVHSLTCTVRSTAAGQPAMTAKMQYLGARMRSEMKNFIMITDPDKGEALLLDPRTKTARLSKVNITGGPKNYPLEMDPVEEIRKMAGKKGEPAGEQQIGQVKAKGIRIVKEDGQEYVVWVDPATDLPVRIEISLDMAGTKMTITYDDLAFDVPLDEKQFSIDPPPGYTLMRQELSINLNIEENVVTLLRAETAAHPDKFPGHLNDPAELAKLVKSNDKGELTPETLKLQGASGALTGGLFQYEKGKTYDYYPDIKPGDAKGIVFWRKDKVTGKFMAVFGDLKIHEIKPDEVPPPSKADEPPVPTPVEK